MGVVEFEQNRLRQQEIEVKALVALAAHGSKPQQWRAMKQLERIAYPEELAEKINYKKRIKRDYFGNCMTCGGSTGDSALLEKCECKQ